MKIILASQSTARRQLLSLLRLDFQIQPANIDESPLPSESSNNLVKRLSYSKASKICPNQADTLVIGSDEVVVVDGEALGKPSSKEDAVSQLQRCRNRWVTCITGLCVMRYSIDDYKETVVEYKAKMRDYSDALIQRYLTIEQPFACAGSLQADGLGIALIEQFSGEDPTAMIGLPLIALTTILNEYGVIES